ncbi:hypothetical protein Hanom_Chr14g01258081 [Helianthus anomalus]
MEILDIKIETRILVIGIFKEETNIRELETQMFKIIPKNFKVQVLIIGEEGFEIITFKGWKIREFIRTLAIKDLVEIINLVQQQGRNPSFKVQVMIMGEEGFKIITFQGRKIREFIGTLTIKDLMEIINLVQ